MEEELIIEIWETFRDHIPEKGRAIAADQFVDWLVDKDTDTDTLEGLKGYDPHLDSALESVLNQENDADDEDDDEDYDNWGDEEEDY
ncbi:MAG: hypothetical protein EBU90_11550 [Proteobacteria bacterium]|nr:hypothetical protein [Pseudomonadota bacterium]NBP14614.1 hypothetical protein [bacterium]